MVLALVLPLLLPLWLLTPVMASVSYDHKAVVINGERKILISGSIHYPRSTPEVRWRILREKVFLLPILQFLAIHVSFDLVFS